ncbi:MAG: metal ABC transporter permease [Dehalococcoidia bacterium]
MIDPVLDAVLDPLRYPFLQRALLEIVIVGALCGVVGTLVVLRGLAFIGDALAHAVFPGVVIAYLAGASILLGALVFGAFVALGIGVLSRSRRVSEDTAIGVLFVAFFAVGIVLISREAGFTRDLGSLLFGSILGVSMVDVAASAAILVVVLLVLLLTLKELAMVAFDATLARTLGYSVFWLDLLLLMLVAATIVAGLQTVGNILILALIVTPAATARLLTDRLGRMMLLSAGIGVTSGVVGLYLSYHAGFSAGATIVLTATACFLLALAFAPRHGVVGQAILRRRGHHHAHHAHAIEDAQPEAHP